MARCGPAPGRNRHCRSSGVVRGATAGLGQEFEGEVLKTLEAIAQNPLLASRRHKVKPIRWRYPARFPYRIICAVEQEVGLILVVAVLHAARSDKRWQSRA